MTDDNNPEFLSIDNPPGRCTIPEKAMLNAEITITSYFDDQGKLKYGVFMGGNVNMAQAVGLLELAKGNVIDWYQDGIEQEEEEDGTG